MIIFQLYSALYCILPCIVLYDFDFFESKQGERLRITSRVVKIYQESLILVCYFFQSWIFNHDRSKVVSFMRHVNNEHDGHPSALYDKCHHGDFTETKSVSSVTLLFGKISRTQLKINSFNILSYNA